MINYNENNINEESATGANGPVSVEKLKDYGKKAYGPLLNVVHKYQDEFTPYLNALSKGLQGGVDSLSKENATEPEKYVSQFFREAADGLNEASKKLESKDPGELTSYLSNLAEKKPSIMFSTSYIAGLFFGRLARHVINKQRVNKSSAFNESDTSFSSDNFDADASSSTLTNEPPELDQSIH